LDNEWLRVPFEAAARHLALPPPPAPDAPGPFSLADPERVRRILADAGFEAIALDEIREPLTIGGAATVDQAVQFLLEGLGPTSAALREADPVVRTKGADAVRMAPFRTADGVRMGSSA
jgi:hypothetical protein